MILAIVGSDSTVVDVVLSDLHRIGGSRVQTLNLEYLTDIKARTNRLELEVSSKGFKGSIKVILGIKTNDELNLLRQRGALVAHVYGAMGDLYRHLNVIKSDFFVSPSHARRQSHVFSPEQLISEGEFRLLKKINSPVQLVKGR
ncbi:hypothetical protein [Shewanella sp. S23-S33]|uniref:hypothetical protein n=1 Tax=Shewanella TaxID=22 RepID=UPI00372D205D